MRPSWTATPSATSRSSCRRRRCGAGLPDAGTTRCHGRSALSVRMIHPTVRALESSAACATSPYVTTRPGGNRAHELADPLDVRLGRRRHRQSTDRTSAATSSGRACGTM